MKILESIKRKVIMFSIIVSLLSISLISFNNQVFAQTITAQVGGVGYTIDETFPDDNMASIVANKLSGGDINHVITQSDITNSITWDDLGFEFISDISGVEYFVNLQSLQLPFNNVTSLPQNFSNLTNLKYLDLSSNLLTELPSDFGNLSSLVNLWISENQLATFPDSFSSLSNLERLEADLNKITVLPNNFGNLSKLKVLFLTYNELVKLPESIGLLHDLEVMRLSDNYLKDIPSSLGSAANLKILWLDQNKLTKLPDSIVNLNSLQNLAIGSNEIISIPSDFDKLTSLVYFSFESNQLTSLPVNFKQMSSLQTIRLYNNLLPSDIVDQLAQFTINSSSNPQDKLKLTSTTLSYNIKNQKDLDQINYLPYLALNSARVVSLNHTYIFDDAKDEGNNSVNLSEYIKNGVVIKSGKVLVKIRATGVGLFPNTSDNAITSDTIQLNFEITYFDLSFNLNGATGVKPETQSLIEGTNGKSVTDPIRAGFKFKGWNTLQNGNGKYWNFLTTTMPANDVTLYAQWEKIVEPNNPKPNPSLPITGDTSNSIGISLLLVGVGTVLLSLKRRKNM